MLTVADYFCGAGGSSSGAELVPGVRVVMAANHWRLAVDIHNANLPPADHELADIAGIAPPRPPPPHPDPAIADIPGLDPRRHPRTDIGWFSPECTNWTVAKGVRCDYDGRP